jgi:hypothetical protein
LQFVGCGDALGSGGRYNTCFHVQGDQANFLIDCGASCPSLRAKRSNPGPQTRLDCFVVEPVIGRAFARPVGSSQ